MDISPNGEFIVVNALNHTMLFRTMPIAKLKYYLIPIHLMKMTPASPSGQTGVEEKKVDAREAIRKEI